MKLQNKTSLTILSIVIAFIAIISVEQIFMILPRFESINLEKAHNNVDEGLRVIDDELNNVAIIVSDYAVWDDTFYYTQSRDPDFITTNFTDDTLDNLGMAFVGICGREGFLFSYDTLNDSQQAGALKAELVSRLDFSKAAATGFITIGEKTYMVGTKRITSTDESRIADYYFVFVRDYLDSANKKLAQIPGASLEILDFANLSNDEKQHLQKVYVSNLKASVNAAAPNDAFYEETDGAPILAYVFLSNIEGNNFGVIRSITDTGFIAQGKSSMHQMGLILVLLGLTIAFISFLFVRHSIINPLEHLKTGLDTLLLPNQERILPEVKALQHRQDEIGELYQKFLYVSSEVKAANKENQRINAQLEKMVLERTRDLKAANEELMLFGETFEETSEGMVITDPDGHITMCNRAFEALSGYPRRELMGTLPQIMHPFENQMDFFELLWGTLKTSGKWDGELSYVRKDSTPIPIWLSIDAIRNDAGGITHYIGVLSDMTTKKNLEDQLERMAFYDNLTGLPNRSLFYIHLQKAMTRSRLGDYKLAVLFIDLDGFKLVNDTFGHTSGDLLLVEVGRRINQNIRESDTLCRWGGDEFTVILENIREKSDVMKIASDLLFYISQDIAITGERISIGASVGIAIYPDDGDTIDQLMIKADQAMYASKSNGKNCYTFASSATENYEIPKIIMINRLKRAITNQEFYLVYQPQISVHDNQCSIFGAEALIRWIDEDGTHYMPDEFISLAEETGMINPMGSWVIEEACRTIRELNDLDIFVPISVNVSVMQFKSNELINVVKNAIAENDIAPNLLYMEITENIFAEDELQVFLAIKSLKALGVKIVLDDFGKGYSSLGLISQMPFDLIKVDKSFTQSTGLEKEKQLAAMIISIGDILNIQSIVEGVETREQVDFHSHNGGRIYQGYFFSKPLDKNDFIDLCLGKLKLTNV